MLLPRGYCSGLYSYDSKGIDKFLRKISGEMGPSSHMGMS